MAVAGVAVALGSFVAPTSAAADGGDYSLDFTAAAPYTYDHSTGGGAYDDRTVGVNKDIVESLEGGDFRCGDRVTYLTQINRRVEPGDLSNETLEMKYSFLADTTGKSGVGMTKILFVGINNGFIAGGVGEGIGGTDLGNPSGGGSTATLVSEVLTKPAFTKGAKLEAVVRVSGMQQGEQVVLRIDVLLDCTTPFNPTGNLQASLLSAKVVGGPPRTSTISVGNQTIPFKQVEGVYPAPTASFANVAAASPPASVARSASSLPQTGSSSTLDLMQLGALLATAGAVGLVAARRRALAGHSQHG